MSGQSEKTMGLIQFSIRSCPACDQLIPGLHYFNETLNMTVAFRLPPRITPDDVLKAARAMAQPDAQLKSYGQEIAHQAQTKIHPSHVE